MTILAERPIWGWQAHKHQQTGATTQRFGFFESMIQGVGSQGTNNVQMISRNGVRIEYVGVEMEANTDPDGCEISIKRNNASRPIIITFDGNETGVKQYSTGFSILLDEYWQVEVIKKNASGLIRFSMMIAGL